MQWITEGNSHNMGNIGIQFLAFSNWKKYNSFSILKQLQVVILLRNKSIIGYNGSNNLELSEQVKVL